MGEEQQYVNQDMPPKRRRRRRNTELTILIVLSSFIMGFVVGAVIIHNKSSKEIAEVKNELATVIEEQSHVNVTNVYVPERKIREGNISLNSYKAENFRIDEGFMAYFNDDGEKISHLGCDLSYHNSHVDFDELAASGCEFVMLRCGYRGYSEGGIMKDEKFNEYASEAQRVGLKIGVYFFTQALTPEEAEEEAEYTLSLIEDYDISYPVAFDTEYIDDDNARTNKTEMTDELRSQICTAFCEKIRENGYYPMIYASENWFRRYLKVESLHQYDFWAPQYLEENDFLYDFTIWQYTDCGSIPGVRGEVDLDISMVDYASFVPAMREAYLTDGKIETFPTAADIKITTESEDADEDADAPDEAEADDE
ncbi:MAG: glycoside hydrolase family 25 protein [Lachnospiraceae bacterium]|nr:glycoside hydrolase family 25 protein [Lachnospiraceae bacterium]